MSCGQAPKFIEGLTWLGSLAVLIDIASAGLSQYYIIPEIRNFHLLEVEHFIPASFCLDVITLFGEAAQHLATTSLMGFTHVAAQRYSVCFACFCKLEVEAIVLTGSDLITLNLYSAFARHIWFRTVVLQAPTTPKVSMNRLFLSEHPDRHMSDYMQLQHSYMKLQQRCTADINHLEKLLGNNLDRIFTCMYSNSVAASA